MPAWRSTFKPASTTASRLSGAFAGRSRVLRPMPASLALDTNDVRNVQCSFRTLFVIHSK
jgi:hypothetical protein